MKEETEKEQVEQLGEPATCPENTKPAKPVGMGINAYCPCNNGKWGDWVDPHIAP